LGVLYGLSITILSLRLQTDACILTYDGGKYAFDPPHYEDAEDLAQTRAYRESLLID
jgi:hypothetical protein